MAQAFEVRQRFTLPSGVWATGFVEVPDNQPQQQQQQNVASSMTSSSSSSQDGTRLLGLLGSGEGALTAVLPLSSSGDAGLKGQRLHTMGVLKIEPLRDVLAPRDSSWFATTSLDSRVRIFGLGEPQPQRGNEDNAGESSSNSTAVPEVFERISWNVPALSAFDLVWVPRQAGRMLATCGRGGEVTVWDTQPEPAAEDDGDSEQARDRSGKPIGWLDPKLRLGRRWFGLDEEVGTYPPVVSTKYSAAASAADAGAFALSLAYSRDGALLGVGNKDGSIRVIDAHTGSKIQAFQSHTAPVRRLLSSPTDLNMFVSASEDGRVILHDTRVRTPVALLVGHKGAVMACDIGPDGRLLASGGRDKLLKIWDMGQRQQLHTFTEHTGEVSSCTWLNSSILLSGGQDNLAVSYRCRTV